MLADLHRAGPVVWSNSHGGFWIVADRNLVEQTGKDWETISSVFENPEEVRLDRPNANLHLTFGTGGHRCLGSPPAQVGSVNGVEHLPFTLG